MCSQTGRPTRAAHDFISSHKLALHAKVGPPCTLHAKVVPFLLSRNEQKFWPLELTFFVFVFDFCVAVYEVFERMAYYGISSNLILYLTRKLHQGTVTAANNVTNWVGTIWMTPILGAYVADAHLGHYWTFVISSAIYLFVHLIPWILIWCMLHSLQGLGSSILLVAYLLKITPINEPTTYFLLLNHRF